MANTAKSPSFGKRRQQHIIILASGDRIRHMTIRPWMTAIAFSVVGMMAVGYLGATSYLVLRDNLIGATMARQARMQHDYEDRIAALRAQVDRVTSRQLLDQQVVEQKVEKLLEQQMALTSRHGRLDSLLDRAEGAEPTSADVPVPAFRPDTSADRASLSNSGLNAIDSLMGGKQSAKADSAAEVLAYAPLRESVADKADRVFSNVTLSLKNIENEQLQRVQKLTVGATQTASAIETILKGNGIPLDQVEPLQKASLADESDDDSGTAIGGPYLAPENLEVFDASLDDLDSALSRLEAMRDTAKRLPFGNPAPGKAITSRFGNRVDPFFGKMAMHAGIDFRERTGGEIRSTGAGTVVTAGRAGGYGNMVEIDHGFGISTRFGHLSRVLVKKGEHVDAGDLIGLAGSTGRSTGTHLHYEVRRKGVAVDPIRFLNAGMKLQGLVD